METVKSKRAPVLTVLALLAVLVLSALMLSQAGVVKSETEAPSGIAEYVNGQWTVDGKPLTLISLSPSSVPGVPIKIVDLGRFFEVTERVQKTSKVIEVSYKPESDSWPGKIILEFQGEKAEIEPSVIKVKVPISGTINPGYARRYGPYSGVIAIQVFVSWTPADQVLDVVCYDAATGQGWLYRLTGGSGWADFSTDYTRKYYVLIGNPKPPNTKTITYSGTIYLYYL